MNGTPSPSGGTISHISVRRRYRNSAKDPGRRPGLGMSPTGSTGGLDSAEPPSDRARVVGSGNKSIEPNLLVANATKRRTMRNRNMQILSAKSRERVSTEEGGTTSHPLEQNLRQVAFRLYWKFAEDGGQNLWLLVAVVSTTRWSVLEATKSATMSAVAEFAHCRILLDCGTPEEILTDRGSSLISKII